MSCAFKLDKVTRTLNLRYMQVNSFPVSFSILYLYLWYLLCFKFVLLNNKQPDFENCFWDFWKDWVCPFSSQLYDLEHQLALFGLLP